MLTYKNIFQPKTEDWYKPIKCGDFKNGDIIQPRDLSFLDLFKNAYPFVVVLATGCSLQPHIQSRKRYIPALYVAVPFRPGRRSVPVPYPYLSQPVPVRTNLLYFYLNFIFLDDFDVFRKL